MGEGNLWLINRNQKKHVLSSSKHEFSLKTNMKCFRKETGWGRGLAGESE